MVDVSPPQRPRVTAASLELQTLAGPFCNVPSNYLFTQESPAESGLLFFMRVLHWTGLANTGYFAILAIRGSRITRRKPMRNRGGENTNSAQLGARVESRTQELLVVRLTRCSTAPPPLPPPVWASPSWNTKRATREAGGA